MAYLLSRNQYKSEKNAKVPYEINKQKFKKFCSQILYAAIANYKNDTTPQQQNHLTPTYNFSVNSLHTQDEQKVLAVMQACYNERTRKVSGLPIWPCHNLISSIISLSDTTLKAQEKRRIKTDLETGFKKFIKDNNFPILFYYLDEEERTVYQIATTICQKLPKTTGESCTISIVLPPANECQAQEPTKLELTEEIGNILKDCTAFLNTANELIAEDNQKETFEELKLEIKENIKKIKTILEGHGIYSQNIKPQPSKERVKTKSVQN